MGKLYREQMQMLQSLLACDLAPLKKAVQGNASQAEDRLSIYQNNIFHSLSEVLKGVYPELCLTMGDKAFRHLSYSFVQRFPPEQAKLQEYGKGLEELLTEQKLKDLARYEWAHQESYYAKDAEIFPPESLSTLQEEALAEVTFSLAPHVRLLSFSKNLHPVLKAEEVLIYRDSSITKDWWLTPDEAMFLKTLQSGKPLAEAVEEAFKINESLLSIGKNSVTMFYKESLYKEKITIGLGNGSVSTKFSSRFCKAL